MNLQANKTDGKDLPLSNMRISAEEWNQLAASCMAFITAAGLTPDALDNEQLLNAFKAIAADLELVGANTNLSNLTETGEGHFDGTYVKLQTGVTQANVDYVIERGGGGTSWYEIWKSGRIRQGGRTVSIAAGGTTTVVFSKEMANTDYSISFSPIGAYTATGEANCVVTAFTTTTITLQTGNAASAQFSWIIEGTKASN